MQRLVEAELRKLATHPLGAVGLVGMLTSPPLLALIVTRTADPGNDVSLSMLTRALQFPQVFAVIAAAVVFGAEFEGSCLRTTFLVSPQRRLVLLAKLITTLVVVLACGALGAALATAVIGFASHGVAPPGAGAVGIAVAKCLLAWLGLALLAFGVSVVSRSLIAPVAVLAPLVLGMGEMLLAITEQAALLPDVATSAAFVDRAGTTLLGFWPGLAVQSLWAAASLVPATVLVLRRDVR